MKAEELMKILDKMVSKDVTYTEALVEYAELNDVEIEALADVVRQSVVLKAKISQEGQKMGTIQKVSNIGDEFFE